MTSSEETHRLTPEALEAAAHNLLRLAQLLERGLLLLIRADAERFPDLTARLQRVAREHHIPDERCLLYPFLGTPEDRDHAALLSLNRPLTFQRFHLIVFLLPDPKRLRLLRSVAPDLLVTIDLYAEIAPLPDPQQRWPQLQAALQTLMRQRHGTLPLRSLFPDAPEHTALDDLYVPLIPLPTPPPPVTLLLGDSGAGKSTRLAFEAAHTPDTLLLPLREYARYTLHQRDLPLLDFLPRWLHDLGYPHPEALLLHLDKLHLLLDGLDEITPPSLRAAVTRELSEAIQHQRLRALTLTARPEVLHDLSKDLLQRARLLYAPPLSDDLTRDLLTRLFTLLQRPEAEAEAQAFAHDLNLSPEHRSFARNPLLLTGLAALHLRDSALPFDRAAILSSLTDLLLDTWVAARLELRLPHLRDRLRSDTADALGLLALRALRDPAPLTDADLEDALRASDLNSVQARRILDALRASTVLLRYDPDAHTWAFPHNAFAEYLAARYFALHPKQLAPLLLDPFNPPHDDLIPLIASILNDRRDLHSLRTLIDAVLTRSRRSGRYPGRYPLLLIQLLEHNLHHLDGQRLQALTERWLEFIFQTAFSTYEAALLQLRTIFCLLECIVLPYLRPLLQEGLRRWLVEHPERVRWDRLRETARLEVLERVEAEYNNLGLPIPLADNAWIRRLGCLIPDLPTLLHRAGLPIEPLLEYWSQHEDPCMQEAARDFLALLSPTPFEASSQEP